MMKSILQSTFCVALVLFAMQEVAGVICTNGAVSRTETVRKAHAAAAAVNLVFNPDLTEDNGIDTTCGWSLDIRDRLTTTIEAEPIGDGAFAVRAKGTGWAHWQQTKIGLVPGAKYRLSYEVRTAGLDGIKPNFYLCDGKHAWRKDQQGPAFPDDTKGTWVRQEATLVALEGWGTIGHTLRIACLGSKPAEVTFAIRNLRFEALDREVAAKSAQRPAPHKVKARIVPVDPLLTAVDPKKGRLAFYWPGTAARRTNCTLVAKLDGAREATAAVGTNGCATVAFGKMKTGPHPLAVEVRGPDGTRLAADEYRLVAKEPIPERKCGRRLNNFVTELVNRPLADGSVEFTRAKAGWTWISFGAARADDADVCGYLDDWGHPVVYRRRGEPYVETQRWISEGTHRLRIVGAKPGRTLKIHAVKTIWGSAPSNLSAKPVGVDGNYHYTLPFAQRFALLSTFNSLDHVKAYLDGDDTGAGFYCERGIQLMGTDHLGPEGVERETFEATLAKLRSGGWRYGRPVNVDENKTDPEDHAGVNFSEAVWTLFAENPKCRVSAWYCDTSKGAYYRKPRIHVSEIASLVNTGDGTGLLMPELYFPVQETRAQLQTYIDCAARFVETAERMVPAAKGATFLYGAGYVDIFDYGSYVSPRADVKVWHSEVMRAYATDPRFAGCAGVAFSGGICCEEEFRRWSAKVIRHYALEGATDDLAGGYGYVWAPGFVKDPDFEHGFTNWMCRATEAGALRAERIGGYGSGYQGRTLYGYGDTVAVFTASAKGASEVSQRLTGLVPGRNYALHVAVADRGSMKQRHRGERPMFVRRAFSARLEGADEVPGLFFEHIRRGQRIYRYVFKAAAPEATLVLTDTAKGKLNEPGTELLVNYVLFRPYYAESEAEIPEIIEALGFTRAGACSRTRSARPSP